ncbi:DUF4064 domain-containing protein [Halobacillus sp. BBL2006]|uniref:DUF4064 domain-containing protein n=1 Tax=Halobacillus sp. BBL2006 TaxID=1543706 RepID=UPI0005443E2C|nr:DUF4064 domain-containing protein [Halobacillus sp. BBL2006]KHE67035.1 hypothetical protein LD39_19640 [Halobacillus sp. BBL2006]
MKRTAEIIFTVIGILLYAIPVVLGGMLLNVKDDPQFRAEIEKGIQSAPNADQVGNINMDQMIDFLGTFTIVILVAAILAIALGILSIVFLKGNKKPKAAGIILIITAIVMTFGTVGLGLFAGVAYLIAGIIALVRKSKKPIEETSGMES